MTAVSADENPQVRGRGSTLAGVRGAVIIGSKIFVWLKLLPTTTRRGKANLLQKQPDNPKGLDLGSANTVGAISATNE